MSIVFRYYIDVVESEGGADLSFPYVSDRELVPNDVIEDERGRVYVVASVSPETTPDPVDDDVRLGAAKARPS
jgi:hypothetical protein